MSEKRKKIMKVIIAIVALAMIVSTFAGIFGNRSAKSNKETSVTESNISDKDKKEIDKKVSSNIPDKAKKDVQNAKVQVNGNMVNGVIVLSEELNRIQSDKVAEQYTKTLNDKYKGKEINVKVVYKNQDVSKVNSANISLGKDIPKANIKISSGITQMDRYVVVKLDTDKPQAYNVEVLGKKLKYSSKKNHFNDVIDSGNEAKIKASLKITPIKK